MAELIEIEQQSLEFLYSFTPFIQIWAGIFLSILFEKILEHSTIYKWYYNLYEKSIKPVYKFQAYDDKVSEWVSNRWNSVIVPKVFSIATLAFIYCLFSLFVIGFGQYNCYKQDTPFIYLITTSLVIIIYDTCCALCNSKKYLFKHFFKYYTAPIYFTFAISILYLILFKWIEYLLVVGTLNNVIIGCTVLLVPLFSLILIFILIPITVNKETKVLKTKLEILGNDVDQLYNALFSNDPIMALSQQQKNDFLIKLYNELKQNGGQLNAQDTLKDFINEEVQKKYDEIAEEIKRNFSKED